MKAEARRRQEAKSVITFTTRSGRSTRRQPTGKQSEQTPGKQSDENEKQSEQTTGTQTDENVAEADGRDGNNGVDR